MATKQADAWHATVCATKVPHKTRHHADLALDRMRSRKRATRTLKAYVCPHCGLWHLGNSDDRRTR